MQIRRGVIQVIVACGIAGVVLTGAAGAAPRPRTSAATVNIVVWQQFGPGHEKNGYDHMLAVFNRTHPGIHVSELPVLDNTKVVAAISGGRPPDVVNFGGSGSLGQYAHQGLLQPLDGFITSSHLNVGAFVPAGWKAVTVFGKRYALPFENFNNGLLYNVKEFQQAGITQPPRTIEELDRDAAKLTVIKNGRIVRLGFIPNYNASLEVYAWLFGGDWFKGNTSTAATAANVQALQWETSYYKKYGASNITRFMAGFGQYVTAADGFESGKVAMMFDGAWNIAYAHENVPSLQVGAAPFPAPAAHPDLTGTSYLDTNPLSIPTGAPHPKEAYTFIQWLATNPAMATYYAEVTVGGIPQLKHVPQAKLFADPRIQVFVHEANSRNAHAWPQNGIVAQFVTNLGNAEQAAVRGTKTPQQALRDLQTVTQQELDSTH